MNDDVPEPLDPQLGSLFAEERARTQAPTGSKERILRRLALAAAFGGSGGDGNGGADGGTSDSASAASAGGGAGGVAGAAGKASALARALPLLGAFLVGGGVGAVAVSTSQAPRVVYVDRVVGVSTSASAVAVNSETALALSPATVTASATPSAAVPAASSVNGAGSGALAREREILDVARTALGRGDGAHALEAVDRHAKEFPQGQMAEEREAIGVQALAKLGRADDAASRGARFRKRYPNSVMTPVIDAAVGSAASRAPAPKE